MSSESYTCAIAEVRIAIDTLLGMIKIMLYIFAGAELTVGDHPLYCPFVMFHLPHLRTGLSVFTLAKHTTPFSFISKILKSRS